MKRSPLLAVLGTLFVLSGGCDRGPTDATLEGTLTGMMDALEWRGSAQTHFDGDTLFLHSQRRNVAAQHRLTIKAVPNVGGGYSVVTAAMGGDPSRYYELIGGDAVSYSAPVVSGTISFTELNVNTGRAVGTMELTFHGARGASRLQSGRFDAYLWRDAYQP